MELITKGYLEYGKGRKDRPFLECDVPIWMEFANGLIHCGGWATNNNFSGARSILCKVPNSQMRKEIYIVTNSNKARNFFSFVKKMHMDDVGKDLKYLNLHEYDRMGKKVYIFEFEYMENGSQGV